MRRIIWTDQAKADVRRLDKPTAMRIFATLHRFAETGEGDVKSLHAVAFSIIRVGCDAIHRHNSIFGIIRIGVTSIVQQIPRSIILASS